MQYPHLVRRVVLAIILLISGIGLWHVVQTSNHRHAMVTVGVYDTRWLDGVYANEGDKFTYRWTMPQSTVRLPVIANTWLIGMLELQSGQAVAGPPIETVVQTDHGQRIVLPVVQAPRQFHVLVAPQTTPTWATTLEIDAPRQRVAGDNRDLGVVLTRFGTTPTTPVHGLPYAFWMALATWVLVVGGIRLLDYSWMRAVGVASMVTFSASVIVAWYVVETLPHWHWLVAWLAICVLWLIVIRITRLTEQDAQGRWMIAGAAVPLILALAWWMLPLFQFVLVADNIYIRYYTYQAWLGPVVLATLGVGAAVAWIQRGRPWAIPHLHLWILFGGLLVVSIFHQLRVAAPMFRYGSGDFDIWLTAARRWVETGILYSVDKAVANPFAVYKRPPFYIMLFTPFVYFDNKVVLDAYRWLNIVLFVATVGIWLQMMRVQLVWWLASIVLLMNFQALYDTIAYGQTDVVLLFCFTVMLWTTRMRRDGWTGGVIAFLTMFKIYPVLLLVFLLIKRRWWALGGFVVGMIVCNALAIAVIGWDIHVQYVTQVFPSIGGTTSWIENQTIAGFVTRFYAEPFIMLRFPIKPIEQFATVLSAILSALVCLAALRDVDEDQSAFAVQYGMFVILMVVAIPVAWMHYTTLLLLVFFIMLWHFQAHRVSLAMVAGVAVSYALVAFGNFRSFNYPTHLGIVSILLGSYKFYGIMLLTGLMLATIWQRHESWAARWVVDAQRLWAFIRARRASPH